MYYALAHFRYYKLKNPIKLHHQKRECHFSYSGCVNRNAALFWRRGAARREGISLVHDTYNVVFRILYWYGDIWTNFLVVSKLQNQSCTFFRIFILGKGRLGAEIQNCSTRKFKINFVRYLSKNVASEIFFLCLANRFFAREAHVNPNKHCFWDGMNLDR